MLHGRGLFFLILAAHLLIINIGGKTLLIETKDREETQSADAEGDNILKFYRSKVSNEPGSGDTDPDQEDTEMRSRDTEDRSAGADDYLLEDKKGDFVPRWVRYLERLKKECQTLSNFCVRWRTVVW